MTGDGGDALAGSEMRGDAQLSNQSLFDCSQNAMISGVYLNVDLRRTFWHVLRLCAFEFG